MAAGITEPSDAANATSGWTETGVGGGSVLLRNKIVVFLGGRILCAGCVVRARVDHEPALGLGYFLIQILPH